MEVFAADRCQPPPRRNAVPGGAGRALLATPLKRLLLWIQLRTRAIDDIVTAFYRDGGRQIVILGAGYDSRATRMAADLAGARFFEVDHPTTQARKSAILEAMRVEANTSYMPWDFESDTIEELPSKLKAQGLGPGRPILTIWEGVIPYLTEGAVEATLAAVRAYSAERSQVMLHYTERRRIESRTIWHFAASRFGEPLRFGWDPAALPEWLRLRSFELVSDRNDDDLARELFPAGVASAVHFEGKMLRWVGTDTDTHVLRQAHESLRDAEKRRDAFLVMLSHELRNPPAPIRCPGVHRRRWCSAHTPRAPMTCPMVSRSTSLRLRRAVQLSTIPLQGDSRRPAVATRSMSRRLPRAAS